MSEFLWVSRRNPLLLARIASEDADGVDVVIQSRSSGSIGHPIRLSKDYFTHEYTVRDDMTPAPAPGATGTTFAHGAARGGDE